jgi:hypothetical protein
MRGALVATALAVWVGGAAWAGSSVPWHDSNVQGSITLYDASGHVLTNGLIATHPFAWRAVGSQPARAPYSAAGRNATLYAYQPRQDVDPGLWSGDMLTGTTPYRDPAHPTVTETTTDFSLEDFINEFPPKWDGFLQLRLLIGATGMSTPTSPYAALNVKVDGPNWSVVGVVTSPSVSPTSSGSAPSGAKASPSVTPTAPRASGSPRSSTASHRAGASPSSSSKANAKRSGSSELDGSPSGSALTVGSLSHGPSSGTGTSGNRGYPGWAALLGVLALTLGLGVVWRQWRGRS